MILTMSPASPVRPAGFGTDGPFELIVGVNALPSAHPARPAPAAQATGRQRRGGRGPAGNSSRPNTHNPMASQKIQPRPQARGSAPGKGARSTPGTPTAYPPAVAAS